MIKIVSLAAAAALLATSAHAQITISTNDIGTPAGAARFEQGVRKAARTLCGEQRGLRGLSCKQAVREEALERLPEPLRMAYVQSRSARTIEYAANRTNEG